MKTKPCDVFRASIQQVTFTYRTMGVEPKLTEQGNKKEITGSENYGGCASHHPFQLVVGMFIQVIASGGQLLPPLRKKTWTIGATPFLNGLQNSLLAGYSSISCLFKVFSLACECLQTSLHCSWQRCYSPVLKLREWWSLHSLAPALVWSSCAYKEQSRLCVSVLVGQQKRQEAVAPDS